MERNTEDLVLGFDGGEHKIYWTKNLKERITEINTQNLSDADVVRTLVGKGEAVSDLFTDENGNYHILFKLENEL